MAAGSCRGTTGSPVARWAGPRVGGQETVMSLLMRNVTVSTKYGGGFVQSIDGLSGGSEGGQPRDWFYFVNGIEASQGAAATNVSQGEHFRGEEETSGLQA